MISYINPNPDFCFFKAGGWSSPGHTFLLGNHETEPLVRAIPFRGAVWSPVGQSPLLLITPYCTEVKYLPSCFTQVETQAATKSGK